ncbi:DedA family protein [Rhizobium leguminosarum]
MAAATFGAIVGDGLSFWLGHRYHREILGLWPLKRYPELVERSETIFKRHGNKSVLIARFAPGVRAFIPLLADMLGMSVRRFYAVKHRFGPGMGTVTHSTGRSRQCNVQCYGLGSKAVGNPFSYSARNGLGHLASWAAGIKACCSPSGGSRHRGTKVG